MDIAINDLQKKVKTIKKKCLDMCVNAQMGHLTSAYSCAEIVTVLYYCIMNIDSKNPNWQQRDRFIMSKNHGSLILYPILADLGFFSEEKLMSFDKNGSVIGSHSKLEIPGIDFAGGSLGMGLGVGAGIAYGARLNSEEYYTYVLLGDGECYEGSVWEAAMFAGHQKLNHLVAIVDRNHKSATDDTERIVNQEPFTDRWKSFGWNVVEINGHSLHDIIRVFTEIKESSTEKPTCIIAETVKGKGIEFMMRDRGFHGLKAISYEEEQIAKAYRQLEKEHYNGECFE